MASFVGVSGTETAPTRSCVRRRMSMCIRCVSGFDSQTAEWRLKMGIDIPDRRRPVQCDRCHTVPDGDFRHEIIFYARSEGWQLMRDDTVEVPPAGVRKRAPIVLCPICAKEVLLLRGN